MFHKTRSFLVTTAAFLAVGFGLACTSTQRATVAADFQRADVVCVALLADKPASAVSVACHLELPLVQVIIDGLAAYGDIQAGVSPGADVSGAVAAALDAGAQIGLLTHPVDAGAPVDAGHE